MPYFEYRFITNNEAISEVLMALLAELPFDTFDLKETELLAYIPENECDIAQLTTYITELQQDYTFTWSQQLIPDENWNADWETSFQPIEVDGRCLIRAPFHPSRPGFEFDILIAPQMSFGTGHHESTYLVLAAMLDIDFSDKIVCDAGCGTGILSVLAAQKGAKSVFAVDHEEWAYRNAIDHMVLNEVGTCVSVHQGDFSLLDGKTVDIILANLNKHILIGNMHLFMAALNDSGTLVVCGILKSDLADVVAEVAKYFYQPISTSTKNDWLSIVFGKI